MLTRLSGYFSLITLSALLFASTVAAASQNISAVDAQQLLKRSPSAYLLDVRRLVSDARKAGLRDNVMAQEVAPKLRALYPDWTISDRAIAAEVRYMDQELAGTKKRPVPPPDLP